MIAMANPFAGYMTVRQVMAAIDARAASTVTRLIYDEDSPRPEGKRLAGTLIPGHGWMIQRKSVEKFLEEEASRSPGVGFPRGRGRKAEPEPASTQPRKAAKRAKKSTRPARKSAGG
jgi:hypothetical protein